MRLGKAGSGECFRQPFAWLPRIASEPEPDPGARFHHPSNFAQTSDGVRPDLHRVDRYRFIKNVAVKWQALDGATSQVNTTARNGLCVSSACLPNHLLRRIDTGYMRRQVRQSLNNDAGTETYFQHVLAGSDFEQVGYPRAALLVCARHDGATQPPDDTLRKAKHAQKNVSQDAHRSRPFGYPLSDWPTLRQRDRASREECVSDPILRVEGLRVTFDHPQGLVQAVDDVSFALAPGERFGLAGESGSGKSTLALAILRMIKPPGRIAGGEVWLAGRRLADLDGEGIRTLRLAGIALVPQGSMNSLNPVLRIGRQITDALADHGQHLGRSEQERRVRALLAEVGLPENVARMYPHELSGGMKQRACIAVAISLRPSVIIADEPTSALDVVVQRQVMATLARVQQDLAAAVILIGHDIALMAQFVDRLAVMYAGRLVEVAPIAEIIAQPRHPYTRALIAALPSLERRGTLAGIPGLAPPLRDLPPGCAFHPRCPQAMDRCHTEKPMVRDVAGAQVACHLA